MQPQENNRQLVPIIKKRPISQYKSQWHKEMNPPTIQELQQLQAEVVRTQPTPQSIVLLKEEKKEREAEIEFKKKKEEIEKRAVQLEQRRKVFKDSKARMKQQVQEKDVTVNNYDNKKQNEEIKFNREEANIKEKKEEIQRQEQEKAAVKSQLEKIEKEIQKNQVYENFLKQVVNSQKEDYEMSIENLMKRHQTLVTSNSDLKKMITTMEQQSEKLKEEIIQEVKQYQIDEMQNSAELQKLKQKFDELNRQIALIEMDVNERNTQLLKKEAESGQVRLAIDNLYDKVQETKRGFQQSEGKIDGLKKLEIIQERMEELHFFATGQSSKGEENKKKEASKASIMPKKEIEI